MADKISSTEIDDKLKKKIEKMVRDELKSSVSEKIILKIVKNAISSLYKTLWMRRATWLGGIENKEN